MLVDRYLARQVTMVLIVIGPALCLLVALLQAMRLLPLVIAAELAAGDAVQLVGTLCVPLSAVALPAATVVTLMMVLARLEGDGELLAFRASGAGSVRLAIAPALICAVVSAGVGASALFAEPRAYRSLEGRLGELLMRSAIGRVRPGIIAEPVPSLTVFARRRQGKLLEQVVIEDRRREPATLLVARRATLEPARGRLAARLLLEDGTIHSRPSNGVLTRASFSRLDATLGLEESAGGLSALVPRRFGLDLMALWREAASEGRDGREASLLLHRRLAVAPGALGLCLITLVLGLSRPIATRTWAIVVGAGLVLGFHLLSRAGEALVEESVLSPAWGGWLSTVACWVTLSAVAASHRLR